MIRRLLRLVVDVLVAAVVAFTFGGGPVDSETPPPPVHESWDRTQMPSTGG